MLSGQGNFATIGIIGNSLIKGNGVATFGLSCSSNGTVIHCQVKTFCEVCVCVLILVTFGF